MKNLAVRIVNLSLLAVLSLLTLFSCTLDAVAAKRAGELEMTSRVARVVDDQLARLAGDALTEDLEAEGIVLTAEQDDGISRLVSQAQGLSGTTIVSRMMEEENGKDYLNFTYTAVTSTDTDKIIESARPLIPDSDYEDLRHKADEIEHKARDFYLHRSRAMTTAQQEKFYKELQSLVVKAVVLLTAAIVYAVIPTVVVWGKVSAACVAAVAAGVVAAGVMTVIGYQRYGGDEFDFLSWIKSVCEDSYAEWAIAASVISTAAAAELSPVMAALVLIAFATYQVFDEAQTMYAIAKG